MVSRIRILCFLGSLLPMACAGSNPAATTPTAEPPQPSASTAAATKNSDDSIVRDAIKKGEAALRSGDFKEAQRLFTGVLDRRPGNARAIASLGVCLENLGDKEGAEKKYRDALAKDPGLADASLNLSALLIDAGRNDQAIAVLRSALKASPSDPQLHANLGHALAATDKTAAMEEFRLSLKIAENAQTRLTLAAMLKEASKGDEAVAELKKALAAAGSDRAMLGSIGDAFARNGAYAECVAAFDKAIGAGPAPELYVQRGLCRHQLKDEKGAKEDYDRALKADSNYAPAWYVTGEYHQQAGNKAEAIKAYEKCQQLKPDSPWGKKATHRLNELRKGKK
jgi:tetratricopeptide (TPR) repeat protein